jgi:ATP-binding cassette, subfamily C (CFTR/MRP), member 1
MAMRSSECTRLDDTFGPHATNCRGGFDFTLQFEETILSLSPLAILLLIAPLRIFYLFKKEKKVDKSPLLALKLVCLPPGIPKSELSASSLRHQSGTQ